MVNPSSRRVRLSHRHRRDRLSQKRVERRAADLQALYIVSEAVSLGWDRVLSIISFLAVFSEIIRR